MTKISRRALAKYAADQLMDGKAAPELAKELAAILIESGRTSEAEFLAGDIDWQLEKRGHLAIAKVTSARPLSSQLQQALKQQIKKATAVEDVLLENQIDSSAIGGLKIETATRVWDKTTRRKLADLREAF